MGRKSVSIYTAHSSSVEKAADWTSGTGKEGREEVEYILSSSMNTDNNQINVPVKVHWKPAVHPVEPLNEDQPAKFPMPPISLSMEEHGAEPSSKQLQSEAQHKMKDAKQKINLGSAKDGEKHIQSPHRPKSLYKSSLYSNKFH